MKNIVILMMFFVLSACTTREIAQNVCPSIIIPRETSRSYQTEINDKIQINLVGFEAYCYKDDADNRYYAYITPTFNVRRLEVSNISNVDADYYVRTSINGEDYIGKRKYIQTLNIPLGKKEVTVRGKTSKNRISAPPYKDFKIYLGLDLDGRRLAKSKKMFDIDYRYFGDEDIKIQNDKAIERVSIEVLPDEEVIYSDELNKPIVVKKNRPKNNCQN